MTLLRSVGAAIAVPALAASAVAQLPPAVGVPAASALPLSGGPGAFAAGPAPFSAPVPITPGPVGIAPYPAPPGPTTTLSSFLGLSNAQMEYRQRAMADTPFGQLRERVQNPLSKLTGGLIKPFPPQAPALAELMDPGAVGAAAKVKFDRLQAKQRIEAVKYLGTVDCHYWPEAEDALVGALRVDRNEWVRLAAAQTLLGGCCCTKKTITALSIAASCSDEDGNPREKSPRVVAAAQAALSKCLAAACAGPVVTDAPVVPDPVGGGKERREGASAMPKPGPYGEEKAAAGLRADEVVRPTGQEFYARVVRASWPEVIAFGKNKMAVAPPVPVEFIRMAGTEAEPVGEDRADRPANLMDYLFGDGPAAKAAPMAMMPPTAPMTPRSLPVQVAQAPAIPARPPVAQQPAAASAVRPAAAQQPAPKPTAPTVASARPATAPQPAAVPVRAPVAQQPAPKPTTAAQPAAPAPKPTTAAQPAAPAPMPAIKATTAPAASPALEMLSGKADPRKVEDAVNALTAADIATPKGSTTLLKAAQTHADTGVRAACVRALARGKAGNPLVLAGLEQLVGDRSVDVRVEAAVALSELKSGK